LNIKLWQDKKCLDAIERLNPATFVCLFVYCLLNQTI